MNGGNKSSCCKFSIPRPVILILVVIPRDQLLEGRVAVDLQTPRKGNLGEIEYFIFVFFSYRANYYYYV